MHAVAHHLFDLGVSRLPDRQQFEMDDLVVLLLGAPGSTQIDRIEGITRLEKLAFLADMETPIKGWLTEESGFDSHNFGPFTAKIYEAVDALRGAGLISDSETSAEVPDDGWEATTVVYGEDVNPYKTRDFQLTELGREYYSRVIEILPKEAESTVRELKEKFADMPLRALVRYVYMRYPEFTDKSLIRDQVLST